VEFLANRAKEARAAFLETVIFEVETDAQSITPTMTDKQANRPILPIPRSPAAAVLEIVAVVGTVLSVALLVQSWKALPPVIPVHFGISGKPDGWGAKPIVCLFPALSAAIYVGLTVLSRFPHTFNYPVPITEENAARQYRLACELLSWLKAELICLFGWIAWGTIQVALGKAEGLGVGFAPAVMLVIFGTAGFYFWQAYRAR
jgi:hypothetical protein